MRAGSRTARSTRCWTSAIRKASACRRAWRSRTAFSSKALFSAEADCHAARNLGAIGARFVDAEHAQMRGEELELLERQAHIALGRMTLDIGIELGRRELAFELIGFELRHVHAIG